jgi:transcriptional regulator with XRE-family HTH domain
MEVYMKKINEIIKDFREDNDLSQIEVANYLKIPRSTYSHYETGNSKIPIDIFIQLCNLYKTTPNVILGFQSKDFPNLDSSKIYKLCSLIDEENIDVDQLIKLIKLSKNMYE